MSYALQDISAAVIPTSVDGGAITNHISDGAAVS